MSRYITIDRCRDCPFVYVGTASGERFCGHNDARHEKVGTFSKLRQVAPHGAGTPEWCPLPRLDTPASDAAD